MSHTVYCINIEEIRQHALYTNFATPMPSALSSF